MQSIDIAVIQSLRKDCLEMINWYSFGSDLLGLELFAWESTQ